MKSLKWNITKKCNLLCAHCGAIDNNEIEMSEVTLNGNKLIKELNKYSKIEIIGGEPTLEPRLLEYALGIKSKDCHLSIVTNGQSSIELLQELLLIGLDNLVFSIEGTQEINDSIRGKGTFNKAIDNIRKIISMGFSSKLSINMTLNAYNHCEIVSIIENIWADIGTRIPIIVNDTLRTKTNHNLVLTRTDYLQSIEQLINHSERLQPYVDFYFDSPILAAYLNIKYDTNFMVSPYKCDAIIATSHMDDRGVISPCVKFKDLEGGGKFEDVSKSSNFFDYIVEARQVSSCNDCIFDLDCSRCPIDSALGQKTNCDFATDKLLSFLKSTNMHYSIKEQALFTNKEGLNTIFFGHIPLLVEYTSIGYSLMLFLKEKRTIFELKLHSTLDENTICKFLASELLNRRLVATIE